VQPLLAGSVLCDLCCGLLVSLETHNTAHRVQGSRSRVALVCGLCAAVDGLSSVCKGGHLAICCWVCCGRVVRCMCDGSTFAFASAADTPRPVFVTLISTCYLLLSPVSCQLSVVSVS
jgi:hypothetical protein